MLDDRLQPVPSFPVYLFDVDGTLMDSAPDICAAQLEVLAANGRGDISEEFLRRYIGRHLIDLFQDLGFASDAMEPLIQSYRITYWDRKHAATRVFPGVAEMLDSLGGRKSTATIKTTQTTRGVLEQFGLIQHFDHVQGTDGFPAKPEPDVILASLRALGADPRGVPPGGRFARGHGGRAPRRCADLRRPVGLREPPGDGPVGAGLLDRPAAAATVLVGGVASRWSV